MNLVMNFLAAKAKRETFMVNCVLLLPVRKHTPVHWGQKLSLALCSNVNFSWDSGTRNLRTPEQPVLLREMEETGSGCFS